MSYRLLEVLGHGGCGDVWRAEHTSGAVVALKLLSDPDRADELQAEAWAAGRLTHPAVVAVLDVGHLEQRPFIALELGAGHLAHGAARDWATARRVLARTLKALAHAHAHGLLHLDVKPQNLLLFPSPEGTEVRLGDFGLARVIGRSSVGHSLHFAPPEQEQGRRLTPAADLYAVGVLATLLLTGRLPFEGTDARDLAYVQAFGALPQLRPAFDAPDLQDWVGRLLDPDPIQRQGSAAAALAALPGVAERPARALPGRTRPSGLGAAALRAPRLVGREHEQSHLMRWFREGEGTQRVTGPAGIGKSALAGWLAVHLAEAGEARVWRFDGRADWRGQLRAGLGLDGADAEEIGEWVLARRPSLLPADATGLHRLLTEGLPAREARALVSRLARSEGPVLAWVDGAAGPPWLEEIPALKVLQTEREGAPGLALGPLSDEALHALIRDIAPARAEEAHGLVARSQGSPGLLLLLLRSGAERGDLTRGALPPHLRQLWLAQVPPQHRQEMERLALREEVGLPIRPPMRLQQAGLATASGLASALLREALVEAARDGGRARAHHGWWADRSGEVEHLLAAGRGAEALPTLVKRIATGIRQGDLPKAARLLDALEDQTSASSLQALRAWLHRLRQEPGRALDCARAATRQAATPHEQAAAAQQEAAALRALGRNEEARGAHQRALHTALAAGLSGEFASLVVYEATALVRTGRLQEAEACLAGAAEASQDARAHATLATSRLWILSRQGRIAEVIQEAPAAFEACLAAGERLQGYHALVYLGDALRRRDQLEGAAATFARAVDLARAIGSQSGAVARINQGICLLLQDQPGQAAPILREAIDDLAGRPHLQIVARAWLLACLDGADWDAEAARLTQGLETHEVRDPELSEALDEVLRRAPVDRRQRAQAIARV